MAGATRRFYTRYYLLTVIAPAYLTTAVFYGAAWLLIYLTKPAAPCSIILDFFIFCAVVAVLLRFPESLARLGFRLSGVTSAVIDPDEAGSTKLAAVLPVMAADGRPVPALTPLVVELSAVPYLAVGGLVDNHLWISTCLLERATTTQLKCLVAHEAGHLVTAQKASGDWLIHGTWLIALPLAYALGPHPLLLCAAALLHALLWLKLMLWHTLAAEAAADAWASAVVGRSEYAAALLDYHGWIAGNRWPTALSHRLGRIGYTTAEIEAARRPDPPRM